MTEDCLDAGQWAKLPSSWAATVLGAFCLVTALPGEMEVRVGHVDLRCLLGTTEVPLAFSGHEGLFQVLEL